MIMNRESQQRRTRGLWIAAVGGALLLATLIASAIPSIGETFGQILPYADIFFSIITVTGVLIALPTRRG
jgi:uncharacterized membrane protein